MLCIPDFHLEFWDAKLKYEQVIFEVVGVIFSTLFCKINGDDTRDIGDV